MRLNAIFGTRQNFPSSKLFLTALNVVTFVIFAYFARSFLVKTSFVGGADFFYYVLTGRDLSGGFDVGAMRYSYFPGVYWFWKFSFDFCGNSLAAIQSIYIGVLLLSSVLCSTCVFVLTRKLYAASLAGAVYLLLLHLLEGWAGIVEPIAAMWMLLGFVLYLFFYQRKMFGTAAVCMMVFLGLCLFMKQQGIFYVAAAGLLPFSDLKRIYGISKWNFIVPIGAVFVLMVLLFIDGGGLEAFRIALSMATGYTKSGEWAENLRYYLGAVEPVILPVVCFLIPMILMIIFVFLKKKEKHLDISGMRIFLFFLLAGLFPLYQFKVRGYLHYGIYTVPSLAILIGWGIAAWLRWVKQLSLKQVRILLTITGALFFLVLLNQKDGLLRVKSQIEWKPPLPLEADSQKFLPVCSHLSSQVVLLLPPRANTFHWICQTRSALGKWAYSWYEENAAYYFEIISQQKVENIFVFDKSYGGFEKDLLSRTDWIGLEEYILKNSYSVVYQNASGRLYKKN